jgi:F-type H+-transporting ATPase subunit gamma
MPNARQLKSRISASQNISKITKAMEMVAASKMRKAQDQAVASRPYARALEQSLMRIGTHTDASLHPLLATHDTGKTVLVVISTDKGLCGGLNTNLFKSLIHLYRQAENPVVVAVGKKAVAFCRLWGLELHAQFTQLPEKLRPGDILPVSSLVTEGFINDEFRSVHLIYMDFINTLSQKVRTLQLLPFLESETYRDEKMVSPVLESEYTFEPSAEEILEKLLPFYLENTIYQVFLEARASEHSARMVAMKNASENAGELVGELKLIYNKSRQASITSELLDITTASLTIKK